jgi:hypothetical protein
MKRIKRFYNIAKAIENGFYNDLGNVELTENSTLDKIKIKVIPHEGFHLEKEYFITLKFIDDMWPLVFIDSTIYDKIKTNQYLKNKGKVGIHKGICIKNLSYGYAFNKHFKNYCNNKWENYIYYIITVFNNLKDFENGNGIKSNYTKILNM